MTLELLNYLKGLCESHVEFNHNESEDPDVRNMAYYEFDYKRMTEGKRRNKYVLFVNKLQGKYMDNRGDYKQDQAYVTAMIVTKMKAQNISHSRDYILECKRLMDDFLRKIEHDRSESLDSDICKLLKHVDYDDITWEQVEITNDLWTGVQMRIPFRYELTSEYDSAKWQ
jgi:hypothetical protein